MAAGCIELRCPSARCITSLWTTKFPIGSTRTCRTTVRCGDLAWGAGSDAAVVAVVAAAMQKIRIRRVLLPEAARLLTGRKVQAPRELGHGRRTPKLRALQQPRIRHKRKLRIQAVKADKSAPERAAVAADLAVEEEPAAP